MKTGKSRKPKCPTVKKYKTERRYLVSKIVRLILKPFLN